MDGVCMDGGCKLKKTALTLGGIKAVLEKWS
jgi:hypothetical protein